MSDIDKLAESATIDELLATEAEFGRSDFYYFTTEILRIQDDSPLTRPRNEVEPICKWLANPRPEHVRGQTRWKRFLAVPRGTAKTTLVSAYVAWRIVKDPNICVYYTSEEKSLALDITESISKMLISDRVEALYGKFAGLTSWQKGKYTVIQRTSRRKDATLMAGGVDVSAQGRHPDLIIADDLQGLTNISPEGIEKVKTYMRLIWPVLNPGGELVYVCTRWDWADMAQDILNEKEKDPSSWDTPIDRGFFSCYAKPGDEEVFPHAVPGEPLFPSILPEEELKTLRQTMNLYHFSCQFKNDPIPSEFQFFKQADFQYTSDYDPNHDSFKDLNFYIGVDPAGGTDTVKRGDDTAIVVIGVRGQRSNRQIYVVECQGGQWKPSQTNETLQLLYEKWRPRRIGIETSGVGKMFWAQLHDWMHANLVHLPLKELKRGGSRESKADRISALEPLYRAHSVFHVPQIKGSILEEQLLRFKPGGNVHDDYPDALTMAVETIREGLQKKSGSIFGLHQKPRYPRMGM